MKIEKDRIEMTIVRFMEPILLRFSIKKLDKLLFSIEKQKSSLQLTNFHQRVLQTIEKVVILEEVRKIKN